MALIDGGSGKRMITGTGGPSQYKDVVLPVYGSHVKDKTVSRPSYL